MALFEYFQSGYRYLRKGFHDPLLLRHYLFYGNRKAAQLQVRRVARALGGTVAAVDQYYNDIQVSRFLERISKAATPFTGMGAAGQDLYVMLRVMRPEVVVETGVFSGVSSSFILKALEDNKRGILYSIDYPLSEQEYAVALQAGKETAYPLPGGKQPGFAIPEELKGRWVLRQGKSKEVLPALLNELSRVDVFLHDSEHTYENMMFEFSAVWDYLPGVALLLSDNTDYNNAFADFAKKVRCKPVALCFRGGLGVIIKE